MIQEITFLKCWSPSFTKGVDWNILSGDMAKEPCLKEYKLLMMRRRSELFLTGKNLDLGTLIPRQLSKHFMAAPTAVSSWSTLTPPSRDFGFTITSMSKVCSSSTRFTATKGESKIIIKLSCKSNFPGKHYRVGLSTSYLCWTRWISSQIWNLLRGLLELELLQGASVYPHTEWEYLP